jgi:hypothetical protein
VCTVCVCLLLQYLMQSCARGGRRIVVVFITAVPNTKDCVCFITAGPITKLCAWGEEESGGHVL